jgi:copper(I)-binding protein
MKIRPRIWFVLLSVFILAACGTATPDGPAEVAGTELRIEGAWARTVPLPNGNSALYFTVVNLLDQPDRLLSVRTEVGMAETHETVVEEGVYKMLPRPEGFEVPAQGTLTLEQGGKHVMVMGVPEPLAAGTTISATFTFASAGEISLAVPVQEGPVP